MRPKHSSVILITDSAVISLLLRHAAQHLEGIVDRGGLVITLAITELRLNLQLLHRIELLCSFNDVIRLNWVSLVSYEVFCNLRTNPPGIHQKNAGAFIDSRL